MARDDRPGPASSPEQVNAISDGPFVSVLIPTWNSGEALLGALASVLSAATPLECIVIDDASSDGTAEDVRALAQRDPRVMLVDRSENGGVSEARNDGLARARGDWLTFLDADDRFTPGGLDRLVEMALATDARAVIGQQVWVRGEWRGLHPLYDIPDIRAPGRAALAERPGLLYFVSPHAKLVHRSTIEGLRFDGRVLGDQPWVIRALLRAGDRIEIVADTVYEWHRPAPGASSSSITATTRSSASRGVAAALVAGDALAAVAEEARRQLADRSAAIRLTETYAERLLRSDLAPHLGGAIERRDPALGLLLDAIAAFLDSAPTGLLAHSTALARDIIEPLVREWRTIPLGAGPTARALLDAAVRAQPDLADHAASPLDRLALRLAVRGGSWRQWAAIALVRAADLVRLPARAARSIARRVEAGR